LRSRSCLIFHRIFWLARLVIYFGMALAYRSKYRGCLLATEYFLYLKTLNFLWNLTGQSFIGLHGLFECNYEWLNQAVDEIAEPIRTIRLQNTRNLSRIGS
jgi:hypothetical protein